MPTGNFSACLGSLKGEGYFKRATGIAVDSAAQRIYVTDTLRHQIWVLDLEGNVMEKFGFRGAGNGQFNFPTELRLAGQDLYVVDAMNFRMQVLDRTGKFQYAIGTAGDAVGSMFRPKGIGVDSEGHLYIVEGLSGMVQVFDKQGQLLYYFGQKGSGFGEFQLPSGLFIDATTACLWWIPITAACRCFSILRWGSSRERKETGVRRQKSGARGDGTCILDSCICQSALLASVLVPWCLGGDFWFCRARRGPRM